LPQQDSAGCTTDNESGSQINQQNSLSGSISPGSSPEPSPAVVVPTDHSRKPSRADSGKLYRIRHGILSRKLLNVLVQMGEDRRTLRRLEKQFRVALRPIGTMGNLFFDRFWSSYMRLMLICRVEARFIQGHLSNKTTPTSLVALVPGPQPALVSQDSEGQQSEAAQYGEDLPPDLFRELVLVQRYDRHHSREMFRALSLLLLLRRGGEEALEDWAAEMVGSGRPRQEG
jgi:hypothetical protein